MMRRLLAYSLIFVIVTSLFSVIPVFAASGSKIQLVTDLGIIEPVTRKTGLIKKGFTRGDFAKALVLMDGTEPILYGDTDEHGNVYAADIEKNINKAYITEVLVSGFMQNDAKGNFNPDKALTKNDATYALIKALGYETVALKNGGTDSAYNMLATMLGIYKGVTIADENKLSHEEVAEILANTMSIRILKQTDSYIDDGIECYFDYLDLTCYDGRILANSNFGIAIESTSNGFVNIDGAIYRTQLLIPDELVGSEVTYYTKNVDGYETIVSIYERIPSEAETVLIKDIYDIEEEHGYLTIHYNEKDKIRIDKSGFAIVNSVTKQPTKKLFESLTSGSITFVKSNGSGNYDLAHITMLSYDVVDGISEQYGTLSLRYSGNRLDLNEIDKCEIYIGKKTAGIAELTSGMPVGIACDSFTIAADGMITYDFNKANSVKIYASKSIADVVIDSIGEDDFRCGDVSYEPGQLYKQLVKENKIAKLSLSEGVTLYLDYFGQIAYYKTNPELNSMKYGYLIGAGVSRGSFNKHVIFRIMDVSGNIKDYETKEKFVLDGSKVEAKSTAYSVVGETVDLTKRQAIRYQEFEGIVRRIDTMALGSSEDETSSITKELDCNAYDIDNAVKYTMYNGVVNSQYAITDNTVVFLDEGNLFKTGIPDNYNFSVMKSSSLPNEAYIECYDSNDQKELGCVVVYTECGISTDSVSDTQSSLRWDVKCYVVEQVTHKIDKDGNIGYGLICAGEGKKVELNVPEETLKLYTTVTNDDINDDGDYSWANSINGIGSGDNRPQRRVDSSKFTSTIGEGDIIRYSTNLSGDVTYIERVFDFSEIGDSIEPVPTDTGTYYGFVNVERSLNKFYIYNQDEYDSNGEKVNYIVGSVHSIVPVYHVRRGFVTMEDFGMIPTATTGQTVKAFIRYYDKVRRPCDHIFYLYD